jgi:hypothetical protein
MKIVASKPRREFVCALISVLLVSASLWGQVTTGKITGTVQDPSGANVPGATVKAINGDTGTTETTTSDAAGNYQFLVLRPGSYTVEGTSQGFNTFRRQGLVVEADRSLAVPVSLAIGQATQVVEVNSGTVLLDVNTSTLGSTIDNSRIVDLPVNGRNPLALATLVPTVTGIGNFGRDIGGYSWAQAAVSIGGGNALANGSLIDGMANNNISAGGSVGFLGAEGMQELKVITNAMAAEYGNTGGGIVSVISKSGTNQFKGTAYEYVRNNAFNANDFFSNAAGAPIPATKLNQFGATAGGPIIRNKLFFNANYEEDISRIGAAIQVNYAPSSLERSGDFSQTLASNGQLIDIYDPLLTVTGSNGASTRTVFAGNKIPFSRLSVASQEVWKLYPAANLPGLPFTHANNLYQAGTAAETRHDGTIKVDYDLNPKQHFSFRYGQTTDVTVGANFFGNLLTQDGRNISIPVQTSALQYTYVISPTLLLDAKVGVNYNGEKSVPPSTVQGGYDITKLGFPASLQSQLQAPPASGTNPGMFPCFNVSDLTFPSPVLIGGTGVGSCNGDQVRVALTWSNNISLSKVLSAHTFKFGWDRRFGEFLPSTVNAMQFSFTRGFTQGPNPNATGANAGFGIASFELGDPATGTAGFGALQAYSSKYNALYAQDDWKLTHKLTLNLGLRWDYNSPITDRFNEMSIFNPNAAVPLNVPGMNLKGALAFPTVNGLGRGLTNPNWKHLGPRFGFAYQAASKLVIRGGYGIIYTPLKGAGPSSTGFSSSTSMVTSLDNGLTPYNTLSDPFPSGTVKPTGSSLGALTGIGQSVSGQLPDANIGYSQQWNLTTQYSPIANWLVEVAYLGNKGTHLLSPNINLDQLNPAYLSLGNALNQTVPNPFLGLAPAGTALSTPTITRQQSLLPYPQFTGVTGGYGNLGGSIFHAGSIKVERRFSRGISFSGSYTYAKLIDALTLSTGGRTNATADGSVVNWYNLRAERSESVNSIRHRFIGTVLWYIPVFNKSKGLANRLLGGWQLNVIPTIESGRPIALTASGIAGRPNVVSGQTPGLANPTIAQWFNTAAYSIPAPFTFGNSSRTIPGVLSDGIVNFDSSLFKEFKLYERYSLQFRAEAFNVFNTVTFDTPGRAVGTGSFGAVSAEAPNPGPRKMQLGLRFNF